MKDPQLPIARKNRHFDFTVTVGTPAPDGEEPAELHDIKVEITGFPTLAYLIHVLRTIQESDVTQQAAAYCLADTEEEYLLLLTPQEPTEEQIQAAGEQLLTPVWADGTTGTENPA